MSEQGAKGPRRCRNCGRRMIHAWLLRTPEGEDGMHIQCWLRTRPRRVPMRRS